jgi:protein-tyrosine kinase
MEHIQQALEKAHLERGSADVNPVKFSGATNRTKPESYQRIDYSVTRKITFDDADLKSKLIVAGFAHDKRAETFRQLRSQILKKMRSENWQTIAITSPNSGNGKTLIAINLAIALSLEVNQTVLLVDVDLKNPSVCKTFGIEDIQHGLVDVMQHQVALEEILINPGFSRLVIVPGISQERHTSEMLSSPDMQQLQMELKNRYADRIIVYDLPALLSSDDALVFVPTADCVLLVLEDGGATEEELQQSLKLLEGSNIIGSVINKIK